MPKKGKQKQQQVQAETVVKVLPEVTEEQEDGFGGLDGIVADDWGAGGGEAEKNTQDHWDIKPEETPSNPRSGGASQAKSAQAEHHATITAGKSGVEKDTKGTKGGGRHSTEKGEAKGSVSWGDGGVGKSDDGRGDGGAGLWGHDDGNKGGSNWDETGGGYDGWEGGQGEGGQGEGSAWGATDGEWENYQEDAALGQTSAFLEPVAPHRPAQAAKPTQSGWMSWGEEARRLAKVTVTAPPSSVGSRNILSPQQRSQILRSLLNQPNQSYSAQHQSSNQAHTTWGYTPQSDQVWSKGNATGGHTQKSEQTRTSGPSKGGHIQKSEPAWYSVPTHSEHTRQSEQAWYNVHAKGGHTQKNEQAWYNGFARRGNVEQSDRPQKKLQRHSEPEAGKKGKKNKQQEEHRGRSQRQSTDGWGSWRNDENDWGNDGDDWKNDGNWKGDGNDWGNDGNDWGKSGNDWGNSGNDWGNSGNDWENSGNDQGNSGNDWGNSGNDWANSGNDWANSGNDWGNTRNGEAENGDDPWNRRVHFSPKKKVPGPSGPEYSMPSKTMAHAYSSLPLPHTFHRGPVQNTMNDYADVRFAESKGAALEPVKQALFGKARLAKDRIHWMFPSDKDERVASLLSWIQAVSYNLGGFGLHKFLQSRERGALVSNADFRSDKSVNEPSFDWLTFDQLQKTRDRILQESVAFYDPAVQVIVFVFLPSKSGNSMAIWRRKIKVPNNLRLTYQREINVALAALRKEKDYIVHVDELPDKKAEAERLSSSLFSRTPRKSPINLKPTKPKRKWWQIFG